MKVNHLTIKSATVTAEMELTQKEIEKLGFTSLPGQELSLQLRAPKHEQVEDAEIIDEPYSAEEAHVDQQISDMKDKKFGLNG